MAADRYGARRNVDVSETDFPARLHHLRTQRRLTGAQLAAMAHLTPRSITDFEKGRRQRVLASSLMLLARALDVSYEDLVGLPPELPEEDAAASLQPPETQGPGGGPKRLPAWPGRFRLHKSFLWLLLLAGLAGGAALLRQQALASADLNLENGALVARDGILRRPLWRYDGSPAQVTEWHAAPWDPEQVVFATCCQLGGRAAVMAANRRTGRILWRVGPSPETMAEAFPEGGSHLGDDLDFHRLLFLDLDGDGRQELLAQFDDARRARSCLCFARADGLILGWYRHLGRVTALLARDIDRDGKDELVAAGQNMEPCLRGASFVLLDDVCCHGASRDSLCGPRSGPPDSSRARLALPSFGEPYMGLLGSMCLDVASVRAFEAADGEIRLSADVGCGPTYVIVGLGADLQPLAADVPDNMVGVSMDWPPQLRRTGPADLAWVRAWLERGVRFEVGRVVGAPARREP